MSSAAQTATLRLNSSMQAMDSWQTYVGANESSNAAGGSPRINGASSSLGSRLISRRNPVNLFRPQRKTNNSIYSIDVPKDTLYLHVDHGKVSPLDREYGGGADSPVSAISNEDSSTEVKPPIPLKATTRGLSHEKRTSTVPRGFSAKAHEWIAPGSRFSWTTQATSVNARDGKSPELPDLPEFDTSLRRHIQQQIPTSRFSWTTYSTEPPQHLPVSPEQSPDLSKLPEEPRSRFSWTTNNTTSTPMTRAGTHVSPRSSASIRHQPPSPPPSPPSVLNRARPIARPDSHLNNAIKRKPTPSELAIPEGAEVDFSGKDLPLSPPEMDSIDIITSLQAQINQLERGRFNLEKAIKNTEQLQLQNPMVHDLAKRRADKDMITRLETELSEIRRQEHELGLRLHRALKRRDQEEPSGLWVRRVTT